MSSVRLVCWFAILLLTSCSTFVPAPVVERSQPPSKKISTHIVGKGETLFSIAWSYGLDFRTLARANGIDSSYTIHPGQELSLSNHSRQSTYRSSASSNRPASAPVATAIKPSAIQSSGTVRSTPVKPKTTYRASGKVTWQWPASGKVVKKFSASGSKNKGVDIAGGLGKPVNAAASGKVVYAGSGLVGYGQLIIIKHNEHFLSAYAHNRVLLVKEGDNIKAGTKIAEIGSSGAESVKLHFEIRRDGKPVDPERYLPRH